MTSLLYGEKYVVVDQQRSFGRCGGNHSEYYIVLLTIEGASLLSLLSCR